MAQLLFRFPLFLEKAHQSHQQPAEESQSIVLRSGGVKVRFDALAMAAGGDDEHPDALAHIIASPLMRSFLETRAHAWLQGPARSDTVHDVFDAQVQRRLNVESQMSSGAEAGDVCGFLFVLERPPDGEEDAEPIWTLKWCELSGRSFTSSVFRGGGREDRGRRVAPGSGVDEWSIVPERTTARSLVSSKREPSEYCFEITAEVRGPDGGPSGEMQRVLLCAKDQVRFEGLGFRV